MNWKEFRAEVKKGYKSQIGVITHDQLYDRVLELRTRPEEVPHTLREWVQK